jgi:hypothetical protein
MFAFFALHSQIKQPTKTFNIALSGTSAQHVESCHINGTHHRLSLCLVSGSTIGIRSQHRHIRVGKQ